MQWIVSEGILIPFLGTTLGAACVFFMKRELSQSVQRALTGFAAGVMVAASFFSLLLPALEQSADLGRLSFLPAVVGFLVGMLFLLLLDRIITHLHTVIGEGGASLSGGEKQRISIARAIMKDAPIIILDEATANVDLENEAELTAAIEELTKEKTIIMIAHRLKTVRHADKIFVINDGRIAQAGTHDELMKEDGIYRRFVEGRREAVSWKIGESA